jgi:phage terminase small subunit
MVDKIGMGKIINEQRESELEQRRNDFYSQFETKPPTHLSERAKAIWHECVPSTIRCMERLALLRAGLEALDRAEQARLAIERDGLTTVTERSGVSHANPMVKIEKDARAQFLAVWQALDFHKLEIVKPTGI